MIDFIGLKTNILISYDELKFQDQIGSGGYGKVTKGQWLGQSVAIKQHTKKLKCLHFLKEVQNISNLRHPNVLLYMGVSFHQNDYFLITEFIEKGSLFDIIKKKQHLSLNHLQVALEIALGMLYLHDRNLLHCDLKSSNILVSSKMKIADFGLSRAQQKQGKKIGTLCWMAPEIMRGEVYTEAADVYSYGVVLWELVSGKVPFANWSKEEIINKVGYGEEKIEVVEGNNSQISQLIKICTQKEQIKRPSFKNIVSMLQKEKEQKEKVQRQVVRGLQQFFN